MEEHFDDTSSNKVEYLKLGLVFVLILGASFFFNGLFGSNVTGELMRWFMGLFFLTFGTFKFIGYEMFTEMFPSYDVLAARSRAYTYAYPFIELLLGCLFIVNAVPMFRDIFTLLLMSVSAYGVYQTIKTRGNINCACLGGVIKLPLSKVSLIENVSMAVMAAIMIAT